MNDFVVKINNFRSVSNATYVFKNGVNVVKGPTGAGKSSIIWAILWCLYGGTRVRDALGPGGNSMSVEFRYDKYVFKREKAGSASIRTSVSFDNKPLVFDQTVLDTFGNHDQFMMRIANMQRDSNVLLEKMNSDDLYGLIFPDPETSPQKNTIIADRIRRTNTEIKTISAQESALLRCIEHCAEPDGPRPTLSTDQIQQQLAICVQLSTLQNEHNRAQIELTAARSRVEQLRRDNDALIVQDVDVDALSRERASYGVVDEITGLLRTTASLPSAEQLEADIKSATESYAIMTRAGFSTFQAYEARRVSDESYNMQLERYHDAVNRYNIDMKKYTDALPLVKCIEKFYIQPRAPVSIPPGPDVIPMRGRNCPSCGTQLYDKAGQLSRDAYTAAEFAQFFNKLIAAEEAYRHNITVAYINEANSLLKFNAPKAPTVQPTAPLGQMGLVKITNPSGLETYKRQLELLKRLAMLRAELSVPYEDAIKRRSEIDNIITNYKASLDKRSVLRANLAAAEQTLATSQATFDRLSASIEQIRSTWLGHDSAALRTMLALHEKWNTYDATCARNRRYSAELEETRKLLDIKNRSITRDEQYLKLADETAHDRVMEFINGLNKVISEICMTLFTSFEKFLFHIESRGGKLNSLKWCASWGGREVTSLGQVSGGERDRLSIAATIALAEFSDAPILFFDETLGSVDDEYKSRIIRAFRGRKMPIVVISHDANEGDYDHIIRL